MQQTADTTTGGRGLLASLRALVPARPMEFGEALRVGELQANRLLELTGTISGPVPSELVAGLRGIRLEFADMPTSGMSYWTGDGWVICLNKSEPPTRQRFTLFHEFKHILDHGRATRLYRAPLAADRDKQAEDAADSFAAYALMPKRLVKSAWGNGIQQPAALASLFEVSPQAISVRLHYLGLTEPNIRCAGPTKLGPFRAGRRTYFRQLSSHSPQLLTLGASA